MVNMKAAFNFVGEGVANIAARQIQHVAPNIAHNVPYAPLANAADGFAYAAAHNMAPVLSPVNMHQAKQAFLDSLNGKANEGLQAVYAQLAEQAMANPEVRNYFTALAQQSGFQGELAEQFAKHMIGQQQFALTHGAQAAAHAPNVTPFAPGYNSTMAHAPAGYGQQQGIDVAGQFRGHITPQQLAAANGNPYAAVDANVQQQLAARAMNNAAADGGAALPEKARKHLLKAKKQLEHERLINSMEKEVKIQNPSGTGTRKVSKARREAMLLAAKRRAYMDAGYTKEQAEKKLKKELKGAKKDLLAYEKAKLDERYGEVPTGKKHLKKAMKALEELGVI
jgi:hypothetical protein